MSADFQSDAWLLLYEIGRRSWDISPAFRKFEHPHDKHGLYNTLRRDNMGFYHTSDELFTVSAFAGWNLTQAHFEEGAQGRAGDRDIVDYRMPVEFEIYP